MKLNDKKFGRIFAELNRTEPAKGKISRTPNRNFGRFLVSQNTNSDVCIIYVYIYYAKKFGCVGRGDLTFLFKSCEIYESQGRLI